MTIITMTASNEYTTEARGVEYFAVMNKWGQVEVWSQRKALKAARMGGSVRRFNSWADVAKNVKAFSSIEAFLALEGVAQ